MSWTVSVKGVVLRGDSVLLARNDRMEWELPGGQLELGESPEQCVEREIHEEAALGVVANKLLDSYVFEVVPGRFVLIVTYGCSSADDGEPHRSKEHDDVRFIPLSNLGTLLLPDGYRRSISAWAPVNGSSASAVSDCALPSPDRLE